MSPYGRRPLNPAPCSSGKNQNLKPIREDILVGVVGLNPLKRDFIST
jgi:hypothetical protein